MATHSYSKNSLKVNFNGMPVLGKENPGWQPLAVPPVAKAFFVILTKMEDLNY